MVYYVDGVECGCVLDCKEDGPSAKPVLSAVHDADEEQHGQHQ